MRARSRLLTLASLLAFAACGDDDGTTSADAAGGGGPDSAIIIDAQPSGGADAAAPCSAGEQHMIDQATGHCYMLFRVQAHTWQDAKPFCEGMGAHLATVSSTEENALMAGLLGFDIAWIGGDDLATEGTFVWDDGEPFTFTNWADQQPNNGGPAGDEDCLSFNGFVGGQWDDFTCANTEYVFCEID